MSRKICFFGSYKPIDVTLADVENVGENLAKNDYIIVSGGFGGSMEQISKGAKKVGGKTVGITCYVYSGVKKLEVNEFVDEEIVTENVFDRVNRMIEMGDAFIVLPGGTGTLFELTSVIEHINKGLIEYKPIIFFGDYWKPLSTTFQKISVTDQNLRKDLGARNCSELITFIYSSEELVEFLNNYFEK